jgi:hypothetical protein
MAGGPASGQPQTAPAGAGAPLPASASVPLFGGHRGGGKRRADGLPAGSPEAIAADREKDRMRKKLARDRAAAMAEPPPLPGLGAVPPGAAPAAVGQAEAPGDSPLAGGAALAGSPMPWDSATLKPLFDQLIPTLETIAVGQLTSRATKARLPGEVVKEIERDAKFAPPAKKALEIAAPRVAAKWMNRTGISAEHQDEVILGTALASIAAQQVLLLKRLDKLIADANPAKAEPAKPPAPNPAPA